MESWEASWAATRIGRFFLFAFLDEKLAEQASCQAYKQYLRCVQDREQDREQVLIKVTWISYKKYEGHCRKTSFNTDYFLNWEKSHQFDLSMWKELFKEAAVEELLSVIWVSILGISTKKVAAVLGVKESTIDYRVSRGVRKLGERVESALELDCE